MLASQRHLFDIPRDVCYLNAAGWSPLPLPTQDAARRAVGRKGQPWTIPADFADIQHERARHAAAALIGAAPHDVALIPSVGYGVAIAGKLLAHEPGTRVLVLENDHSSPVLEWLTRAPSQGFTVETIPQPANGDWTSAVLDSIDRPGAPPVSLASISSIHWSDGGLISLVPVRDALRKAGGRLLVDATHAIGVIATDVARLDPDFLIFPTYKWVLGPYGRAFIYVAPRHQDGIPLEQTAHGRRDVRAESPRYLADIGFLPDARRFDMGERDHFISMEMASIGMEMLAAWGAAAVTERLADLTRRISAAAEDLGYGVLPEKLRAPNILSLAPPRASAKDLAAALAREKIYVAPRVGRVRVAPHVYTDDEDIATVITALRKLRDL
jgi:selenocysteine lyase/cysteine desulfurase